MLLSDSHVKKWVINRITVIFFKINKNIADISLPLCPDLYTLNNGSCFKMVDSAVPFDDADDECKKLPGRHLVTFNSMDEWKFLLDLKG